MAPGGGGQDGGTSNVHSHEDACPTPTQKDVGARNQSSRPQQHQTSHSQDKIPPCSDMTKRTL
eukprot:7402547-Pyramimonas_sp.AAC.1